MSLRQPNHRLAFTFGLSLMVLMASARAFAAEALAVVGVTVEGDTPAPNDLAAALRRGFVQGGFTVPAGKLDPGPTCTQHDCYAALAAKYKANLLAWAKVQSSPQNYEVEIRVVAADAGEAITVDHIRCAADDLCPPMPQTIQRLAKEAARKVRLRLAEAPVAAKAPPPPVEVREPVALASPTPPPPPADVTATFAPPRIYDAPAPTGPLWLGGASVAVLGVSGVLFAYNSTCSDGSGNDCNRRDFKALAAGVGIAGLVGLGTAAAWWLTTPSPAHAEAHAGKAATNLAMVPWADQTGAGLGIVGRLP